MRPDGKQTVICLSLARSWSFDDGGGGGGGWAVVVVRDGRESGAEVLALHTSR